MPVQDSTGLKFMVNRLHDNYIFIITGIYDRIAYSGELLLVTNN
jgi:hypothetical protein